VNSSGICFSSCSDGRDVHADLRSGKGKDEAKKGTSAVEKKAGQEGDAKKADTAKKEEPKKDVKKAAAKKGTKKGDKKEDKKDEKKST